MIVEFIGCTGAGKTTLIQQVQRRLTTVAQVMTSVDLATSRIGLRGMTNPTIQNLIQELVAFPFFVGSLFKYREFIQHTIKLFWRNSHFSLRTISNLRSLERKLGMYEIMSHYGKDRIVLVDEGPILAAHMFVFTGAPYTREEITRFTTLLPLPDLIIYVRASVQTLVKRTLQRVDAPREINKQNVAQIERYAKSAVILFDQLVEEENTRCRLLVVESLDFAEQGYSKLVEDISQRILNHTALTLGKEQ
jgi:deoxyadenosine/deoxycytidine kinase